MNIFVAKLNYRTTKEELEQAFAEFGEVTSAKVIMDRETGRSKGYGFVEMENSEHADEAIRDLNGHSMDGRQLTVNEARERSSGGGSGGGGGGGRRY